MQLRNRFSLIVATVGRIDEVERLFKSLVAQTFTDFEVLLVDQNRGGELDAIAAKFSTQLRLRHLRLEQANLSLARNVGLQHATGTWIAFPDDDCWYLPDVLQKVEMRVRGDVSITGVILDWHEGDVRLAECEHQELAWERSSVFRDVPYASYQLFFARELFARVGQFDQRLGVGQFFGAGEETDVVLRALRRGERIVLLPQAVVRHPLKPPKYDAASLMAANARERGVGALWAKHDLPKWVVLRGLVAPFARSVLTRNWREGLKRAVSVSSGRMQGYVTWGKVADENCASH